MLIVNFRRIFLTALFVLGAGTLLLGYNGLVDVFLNGRDAIKESGEAVQQTAQIPETLQISGSTADPTGGGEEFFVDYKMQRERARSQQVEILKDIVNSPSTAGETRQLAQDRLLEISAGIAREVGIENLLKARGYRHAVVSMDQKRVTVVIGSQGLSSAEEAEIIELVSRETGFGEQGILILQKK